ncbi:hypothetical protein [Nannocystis pusilla]|uniref:Uncharacterized protein n=1 Tax=Nannocystis pusilla TaxID=889268 RepID=A0ABS7TTW7_9BACT|nr:hypothetical protein [Nannocystis pusilla]MBZ5711683.1 hypothetical protein [Nannocystis pusilla]
MFEDAEMTPLEQLVNRRTVFYSSYLRAPKTFTPARPATGDIGAATCREYVRMSLRELEGEACDAVYTRDTLRSSDDFPLVVFRSGAASPRPPMVLRRRRRTRRGGRSGRRRGSRRSWASARA